MLAGGLRVWGRIDDDVFWQIDHHRTGPAAAGNIERLMHHTGEILGPLDQVVVLGCRPGDARGVGFLKSVVADQMRRHLTGQADDRDAVHQCIDQAGYRVRRTRPRGHQHHANAAGGTGVALSRMYRATLLANQDVPDSVLLEQRIVDRQYGAAGIAENNLYALILEGTKKDFCSRLSHIRRHSSAPVAKSGLSISLLGPLGQPPFSINVNKLSRSLSENCVIDQNRALIENTRV